MAAHQKPASCDHLATQGSPGGWKYRSFAQYTCISCHSLASGTKETSLDPSLVFLSQNRVLTDIYESSNLKIDHPYPFVSCSTGTQLANGDNSNGRVGLAGDSFRKPDHIPSFLTGVIPPGLHLGPHVLTSIPPW